MLTAVIKTESATFPLEQHREKEGERERERLSLLQLWAEGMWKEGFLRTYLAKYVTMLLAVPAPEREKTLVNSLAEVSISTI